MCSAILEILKAKGDLSAKAVKFWLERNYPELEKHIYQSTFGRACELLDLQKNNDKISSYRLPKKSEISSENKKYGFYDIVHEDIVHEQYSTTDNDVPEDIVHEQYLPERTCDNQGIDIINMDGVCRDIAVVLSNNRDKFLSPKEIAHEAHLRNEATIANVLYIIYQFAIIERKKIYSNKINNDGKPTKHGSYSYRII